LGKSARFEASIEDELHAFNFGSRTGHHTPAPSAPPDLREALEVLGLVWPVSMIDLKAKYKQLAKLHHPDANGGDKESEEVLKSINLAYATLRGKLTGQLAQTARPAAE
jgi:DnaJ-domain-containing protein 1